MHTSGRGITLVHCVVGDKGEVSCLAAVNRDIARDTTTTTTWTIVIQLNNDWLLGVANGGGGGLTVPRGHFYPDQKYQCIWFVLFPVV